MEIEPSWDVSLYKIDKIKSATKRPWRLRWRVGKLKRPPFTRYSPVHVVASATVAAPSACGYVCVSVACGYGRPGTVVVVWLPSPHSHR